MHQTVVSTKAREFFPQIEVYNQQKKNQGKVRRSRTTKTYHVQCNKGNKRTIRKVEHNTKIMEGGRLSPFTSDSSHNNGGAKL